MTYFSFLRDLKVLARKHGCRARFMFPVEAPFSSKFRAWGMTTVTNTVDTHNTTEANSARRLVKIEWYRKGNFTAMTRSTLIKARWRTMIVVILKVRLALIWQRIHCSLSLSPFFSAKRIMSKMKDIAMKQWAMHRLTRIRLEAVRRLENLQNALISRKFAQIQITAKMTLMIINVVCNCCVGSDWGWELRFKQFSSIVYFSCVCHQQYRLNSNKVTFSNLGILNFLLQCRFPSISGLNTNFLHHLTFNLKHINKYF